MEASGCRIVRYGKEFAEFSIYDVADIHLLNRGVSKSHLIKDIEKIKADTYALFFEGGDYADWIFPGDPRFDPSAFDENMKVIDLAELGAKVSEMIINYFKPIRRKCLGFLIGNHEFKAMNHKSQTFVHDFICKSLNVPNMRFSGFTDVYFVHEQGFKGGARMTEARVPPEKFTSKLRIFIHHGMGAANTAGGKINKLKSLVDMVDADLVMMGHVHEQFAKAFLKLVPNDDCSEIGQKATMGLITATTLGATRARYIPAERILTVENRADNVGTKG